MNMPEEDIAVDMIALHGGKLVGRTRLQKRAYLLHRCGANFDLPFVYHHYGPYSFDLAEGCIDAQMGKRIKIKEKRGRYGIRYAIFRLKDKEATRRRDRIGALPAEKARSLLKRMERVSDIVLELAATVVFLRDDGRYPDNAVAETKARKPLKATDERLGEALSLIRDLGLDPENALELPA